jgi:hypothetical protein
MTAMLRARNMRSKLEWAEDMSLISELNEGGHLVQRHVFGLRMAHLSGAEPVFRHR